MAKKPIKLEAVKAAESEVKRLRKQTRALLAKANRSLKDVRKDVRKLQKGGLFRPTIKVAKYQPTRYILSKLKRNADIIAGKAVAVKAPKEVREQYVSKGLFEQRYGRLIVPKEYEDQETDISRGMVRVRRKLKFGQERRIYLPFKATDLQDIALRLRDDPSLGGLKEPDEMFGFRLFGHSMNTFGFPDAEMLSEYILQRYQHLFEGKSRGEAVRHFQLIRFRARDSVLPDGPEEDKTYSPIKRPKVVKDWLYRKRSKREAARKRRERANEAPERTKERLEYQRTYAARARQRKFEES